MMHNGRLLGACEDPTSHELSEKRLDGDGFSLSTWNIYKTKLSGWNEDLDALDDRSDILLLQEAHLQPGFLSWLEKASLDWSMAHAFSLDGGWSGVFTGSKVSQMSPCAQRVVEPYLRLPKTALISYFPFDGGDESLLVINVHGVNFTLGARDLELQFQMIGKVIEKHQGPVVLAGDFNTWNRKRLKVIEALAGEQGLSAVSFAGKPASHGGYALDHIYYRGLKAAGSHVTRVSSSDHHPLTVTFKLDPDT